MKKNFITGFITGGIICAAVTGFAVEYAVTTNPYPVKVNGVETAIQGYNINDETYFKLRDVSEAVGGFEVGFEDNAIIVNTPSQPTATPEPTPTAKDNLSPLPEVATVEKDGVQYVNKEDIEDMLKSIGLGNYEFSLTQFYDKTKKTEPSLLTDIPYYPDNENLIPIDYYNNTIIPIINTLR